MSTQSASSRSSISLYYNRSCADCVLQAARTARLDWLDRVELRTDQSPLGEVPVGEIVVVEKRSDRAFTGIYPTRKVCMRIPLLFPYGLALFLPPIRDIAGRGKPGCNGEACHVGTSERPMH